MFRVFLATFASLFLIYSYYPIGRSYHDYLIYLTIGCAPLAACADNENFQERVRKISVVVLYFLAVVSMFGLVFYIFKLNGFDEFDLDGYKKSTYLFSDANTPAFIFLLACAYVTNRWLLLIGFGLTIATMSFASSLCYAIFLLSAWFSLNRKNLFVILAVFSALFLTIYKSDGILDQLVYKNSSKIFILEYQYEALSSTDALSWIFGSGIDLTSSQPDFSKALIYPLRHTLIGYFHEIGLLGIAAISYFLGMMVFESSNKILITSLWMHALYSFVPIGLIFVTFLLSSLAVGSLTVVRSIK